MKELDPSGGDPLPVKLILALSDMPTGALAAEKTIGEVVVKGVTKISQVSKAGTAIGTLSKLSVAIQIMHTATSLINTAIATKQIGSEIPNPPYWILYTGTKVNVYEGDFGNTDHLVKSFKGTSGIITFSDAAGTKVNTDYRNSKYQYTEEEVIEEGVKMKMFVGPLPEGNYSIDLSLDPDRQAKLGTNGETIPGKGLEKITYFKDGKEYVRYPSWGSRRAKLDADPGTKLGGRDGNFYFHNSHKGYTHGCVETEPDLFTFLISIRQNQPSIRVKIKYKSKNVSTNGHTGH